MNSKNGTLLSLLMGVILILAGVTSCTKEVKHLSAKLVHQNEASLGNGAIWHPERKSLFWVDIEAKTLYEYLPGTKSCNSWKFKKKVTTVVPETSESVVLALENSIVRFHLKEKKKELIAIIADAGDKVRFNEGKCSPSGSLWVGTMSNDDTKGAGTLYCISPTGRVDAMIKGVSISNGIVWSSNKKYIYYNDSPTGKVQRFRYNSRSGDILLHGTAVTIKPEFGLPDGMTIDQHDNIWVAQWGGFGVYCYNPYTGEQLMKIEVPAPNVTSCAFGGEKMDVLYITTAREGLSEEDLESYPLSGSLFACRPGVHGIKPFYFGQEND